MTNTYGLGFIGMYASSFSLHLFDDFFCIKLYIAEIDRPIVGDQRIIISDIILSTINDYIKFVFVSTIVRE
jgi:hypothetical protein